MSTPRPYSLTASPPHSLLLCALCALCANLPAAPRLVRQVETSEVRAQRLDLVRGETVDIQVRILNYGRAVSLAGAAVTLHAQTNGMASGESWQLAGTAGIAADASSASNGWAEVAVAVADWIPADFASGTWTLEASWTNPVVRVLRAGGALAVSGTAAADGAAPPPVSVWTSITNSLAIEAAARAAGDSWAGTNWVATLAAEAAARAYGDIIANTNHQAALLAEALARAAGDAAVSNLVADLPTPSTDAWRLVEPTTTQSWVEVIGGTSYLFRVQTSTDTIRVAATGGEGYNGPAVGTTWTSPTRGADYDFYMGSHGLYIYDAGGIRVVGWEAEWNGSMPLPARLSPPFPPAAGWMDVAWQVTTNRVPLASTNDVHTIGTTIMVAHNEDGGAHADLRAQIESIPTNVVGGWLVYDEGSNRWWRVSATNLRFYVWSE